MVNHLKNLKLRKRCLKNRQLFVMVFDGVMMRSFDPLMSFGSPRCQKVPMRDLEHEFGPKVRDEYHSCWTQGHS